MKKYLLLMLVTNLLLAEELEVNKEVQGVNQKVYTEVSEINTDKKEIKTAAGAEMLYKLLTNWHCINDERETGFYTWQSNAAYTK